MLIYFNVLSRNALRSYMSSNRFYAVDNSSKAVCSFAAAKVLLFCNTVIDN